MSDACERLRRLLLVWQTSVPAILLMPRGMQGVLPCSHGTVNAVAHNTVDAQRHVGEPYHVRLVWELMAPIILFSVRCTWRLHHLLQVWQTSVPAILLIPRGMQGVLPCSPGTVNIGAHNTIDASEARGEPYRICLVWELMVPTTL